GLTFGTVPFLLKSIIKDTSFTQLGIFSIATYPYSLKILWSPIVDSIYSKRIGRRRSWIIPTQLVSGVLLFILGVAISRNHIFKYVDDPYHGRVTPNSTSMDLNIPELTAIFTILVFLCATQDIAVDGWALTILSKQSLSYAATAQTIGLNIGYFLSFTVFISFNSMEFINSYFRTNPLSHGWVSLGGYMKFSGIVYILVTVYIMLFTKEHPSEEHGLMSVNSDDQKKSTKMLHLTEYDDKDIGISNENPKEKTQNIAYIYSCFIKVLKLPPVQTLSLMHLTTKFAFQCNEAATNLKLLEKGFRREDLAITVLIDFPFEIVFGYYVAKWSSTASDTKTTKDKRLVEQPNKKKLNYNELSMLGKIQRLLVGEQGVLTPWLYGFIGRLVAAILANFIIHSFPADGNITKSYFLLVILQHLLGSFMQTVQFVSVSSFHTRIADPVLGGTYMTLLNTLSNFGGTWPRLLIMSSINHFTIYKCTASDESVSYAHNLKNSDGTKFCDVGDLELVRDGYYFTNWMCIIIGICLFFGFLRKSALKIQKLPIEAWRTET
ncbi:hypothetical protein Kpol_461p1, partial [Vanderwaltozyma polyspora DSM 70294]